MASNVNTVLLTREDVAKRVGVTSQTVSRYVRSGQLKAYKFNKRVVRFREEDVEAFINRNQQVLPASDRSVEEILR